MVVNENTELRKLRPAEFYNFALLLSPSENWKKLVSVVTKEGTEEISKFDGETIAIIEHASCHERKPAAAIFLEEWATMGRKRPTLGLLLNLLMKAELFRAADYLAEDILKVEAPARPTSGPAVPIDVEEALVELLEQQNLEARPELRGSNHRLTSALEINLRQIDYPMHILDSETSDSDNNFAAGDKEIGIIEMRYEQSTSNQDLDHAKRFKDESSSKFESNVSGNSDAPKSWQESQILDLIEFSSESNRSDRHKNFEISTGSDLIKFQSAKIDRNVNEMCDSAICEAILPNFDISCRNSMPSNERRIEINEKSYENRVCQDSHENTNYAVPIREMSSTELPAILKDFAASKYFHREVTSSELPLCINDRTGFNSSESVASPENSSIDSSQFHNSSSLQSSTEDSTKIEPAKNRISADGFSRFVAEARINEENEDVNESAGIYGRQNGAYNSQELPITVLEFQRR